MTTILIVIILLLIGLTFYLSRQNNTQTAYLKALDSYVATEEEIKEVKRQIQEKGFWEDHVEWRISTVTSSRIEPKLVDGKEWFITTVKCEQEVMVPAKTIERAIVFRKVHEHFQAELWHKLGWASWTKKKSTLINE